MDEACVPRFAPGVRLRDDPVRQQLVVLAPERLFIPDEHAAAILKLVDGVRTLAQITEQLAALYDAPRDRIADDVAAMLDDLARKGAVVL